MRELFINRNQKKKLMKRILSSNSGKYGENQIKDVKISQSKQAVAEIIKIQHSKTEEPSKSVVYSDLEGLKHLKKLLEFLPLLRCPNSKEKLGIVKKNELLEIFKGRIKNLPAGNEFLINESASYLYRIASSGYPLLLPEEVISLEILPESITTAASTNTVPNSFKTLEKHKQNLEIVYTKEVRADKIFHNTPEKLKWKSGNVHKVLADGLKPGSVLDVGGGWGPFRRFTNGRFHLIVDVSEIMLNTDPSPYKLNGRSEYIPVMDESFDNVVSSRSMEHCQDPTTTMKELVRCLKPEGRLVVAGWREDWPACLKGTIWGITNFLYFIKKVFAMAKHNPDLLLDRALYKLKIKKTKSSKYVKNLWGKEEHNQIYKRRFNRDAFQKMLENAGVEIIKKGYCGKDFPGFEPPEFIVDKFFDSSKYGSFFYFICRKPSLRRENN